VYIQTKKSMDYINADKNNKSGGFIMTYEGGELTLNTELKQIKGRGNSTWNYDKKGYNIKFDEKTEFLGMKKAKKWSMIACYLDPAMDKNPLGWELANQMGLHFSSDYRFVDLYLNGVYNGTYLICESVEIGENRVDITDLTKETEKVNKGYELEDFSIGGLGIDGLPMDAYEFPNAKWVNIPNDPSDITGGYLLECEYILRAYTEVSAFTTDRGQPVVVKEPEYASEAQVRYISSYWQEAEDAICSEDGYNTLGKHYSEYFDMESLVNMYILLEFSGNPDAGVSSTFFYKDRGGKLVASPIWDNDTGFGNISVKGTVYGDDPSVWITNRMSYSMSATMPTKDEYPTIYNRLYRHEDFRKLVSERWSQLKDVFNRENVIGIIDDIDSTVAASCRMNGIRWYSLLSGIAYEASKTLSESYVISRIEWLDKGFGAKAAQLYYDSNGGEGWTVENSTLVNGDTVVVKGAYENDVRIAVKGEDIEGLLGTDIIPPEEGMEFSGWNTKPDGSGITYQPGKLIKVKGMVVLYAQWVKKEANRIIPTSNDIMKVVDNPILSSGRSLINVCKMVGQYTAEKIESVSPTAALKKHLLPLR